MKCTLCSKGCEPVIQLSENGSRQVTGCGCSRGQQYFMEVDLEDSDTYKLLVPVKMGYMKHILAVSDQPVPFSCFSEITKLMAELILEAPIEKDQVILSHPLGLKTNIRAARRMKRRP